MLNFTHQKSANTNIFVPTGHRNMTETAVSVILPIYNGSKYLSKCIKSILDQSYQHYEFIVIDDGSTDDSAAIVANYPAISYWKTTNQGVAAARNLGIEKASGDWICFIDQDDIWTNDSLKLRLDLSQKMPHGKVIIGKQKWFLDGLNEVPSWVKPEQMQNDLDGYLLGCALLKKDLFEQYGLFDTSFRFSSDFDWFFRLKDDAVKFNQIDEVVLEKRIHALNESRHAEKSLKELSRAIYHSIKRKRARATK